MITIKQQAELSFHHVDVKDAVIMANLMNRLSKCIVEKAARKFRNGLSDDVKAMYNSIYINNVHIDFEDVEGIFNVLTAMGFVATEEYSIDDILAEHLKKD